jgi:membrane-bound lytic murein transglycosylase D
MNFLRKSLLGAFLVSISLFSFAQENSQTDTTVVITQPEIIELSLIDSSLVRERLANLQKSIPLTYNSITHQFVEYFGFRKASFTKTMLERKNLYFPLYERTLAKYGLPDELKYLSLIESGLNPKAISKAKAVGLWQFMAVTARHDFGVRIDEYVDDRMNPEVATDIACRYLRQLYNAFGDWHLALAAYNTGPGNIKKALRRCGNGSFWKIYNCLPRETRGYVPQFIGIVYMMNHASDHEIFAENIEEPILHDTIQVNAYLNIAKLSEVAQINLENIQKLNPHILKGELPSWTRNFSLKLPSQEMGYFLSNRKMVLDSASRIYIPRAMPADAVLASNQDSVYILDGKLVKNGIVVGKAEEEQEEAQIDDDPEEVVIRRKPKRRVHIVRKGETLYSIADKYDVELYDLKVWNKLRRKNHIEKGQRIVVYTEQAVTSTVAATRSNERKNKFKNRYHRVQSGDTLWNIAHKYGIDSIEKLKRMNGIKNNVLKQGMKIRIG